FFDFLATGGLQFRPAAGRIDAGDPNLDGISQAQSRLLAVDQRHLGPVQLLAPAGKPPRGKHPLVDVAELAAEGDEGAGPDHAGDLAFELGVWAALAELALAQVGGADVDGTPLHLHRLALTGRAVGGDLADLGQARRLLPLPQRRQQGPVPDPVGVAPYRRGEVGVGSAAEAGVAAVALAVDGLLEGAEHERCIRLAAVPAPRG